MANKYVVIDNSYSTDGTGTDFSPFTWNQFLTDLSGGGLEGLVESVDYYLSGTRTLSADITINVSAIGTINYKSWNENSPAIIQSTKDIYFEQYCPTFGLYDLLIQAAMTGTSNNLFDDGYRTPAQNYGNVIIDNCYLKLGTYARFSNILSFKVRNSIIIATNLQGSCSTLVPSSMSAEFINTIFDISDFNATTANNVETLTVDNCAFTSALTAFTQDTSDWTNIHESWTRPSVFSSAVSAINIVNNLKYIDSPFSLISATGDTSYTNTWLSGTRDGIGALYFPEISGVAVSASSASSPLDYVLSFVISGNDPFTVFSASSATYSWDDGTSNSAVNNNSVISHSFSANGSYQVESTILSFNEWYTVTATAWIVLVGNFNVTIVIYDQKGNNVTGGLTKPLNNLTFSASVNGLDAGSYIWDLGDGYSATSNPSYQYYISEGLKNIRLSAFALDDSTVSAIDTSTITISAISSEYFVNITSAYDVCANNVGTSADPFNWSEFKGMVETSGEYLDTYRLSGSRLLSANSSNRNVLNIDKTKNFTIRDWDVSAYGPWVLEVADFSVTDSNTILSATGCILRNGIIYNKPYSSPGYGGQIIIGTTYDMFIVYQGTYSHIIVDPFKNVLSGGLISGTSSTTVWSATSTESATSSDYCSSPDWVYMDTYIGEDFKCSACSSACIDDWWADIKNYKFVGPVTYNGYYGCIMYDTPERYFSLSAISGDFDLQYVIAFSATGGNVSVHLRVQNASSATQQDLEFNGTSLNFNSVSRNVSLNAGQRAIKMRLLRIGTGTPNTSAYYWHYSPVTCANVGDVIGSWNYLNSATINVPVIFKSDAGDNGVGYGTLKFQADDGFPYTPTISEPLSTNVPNWVSASSGANFNLSNGYSAFSWIIDDFETSSFDCWWGSRFTESYQLSSVSGSMVAIMNFKDDSKPLRLLSREGTSLSGDFVFETSIFRQPFVLSSSGIVSGSVTDIDGNVYSTVVIGNQEWMTQELRTTRLNDGTSISAVTADASWSATNLPARCCLDNDCATYSATYGFLYNLYAASANIAPTGWRVPTSADFQILKDYLGLSAGTQLKTSGTTYWVSASTSFSPGTNSTGFSAIAAGYRSNAGLFGGRTYDAYYWTLTPSPTATTTKSIVGFLAWSESDFNITDNNNKNGASIRLVRDTSATSGSAIHRLQGISVFETSANIDDFGNYNSTSGCIMRLGVNSTSSVSGAILDNSVSAISAISALTIGLRIERDNGVLSAFYKDGSADWVVMYPNATWFISNSNNVYVVVEGNGYEGFDYFRIASQSGLPNIYTIVTSSVSALSSVNIMTDVRKIITSAQSDIIGSTIYLSAETVSAWQDNFLSASYSTIGQSQYSLYIVDSVMTNFEPDDSDQFSACNVFSQYSTFNRAQSSLSSDFNWSNEYSQYEWTPPEDYPFTRSNILFDKDIDYIRANKKLLRPFSGITTPPNPGKNAPTYSGYETGLFGYMRNEYNTSGV